MVQRVLRRQARALGEPAEHDPRERYVERVQQRVDRAQRRAQPRLVLGERRQERPRPPAVVGGGGSDPGDVVGSPMRSASEQHVVRAAARGRAAERRRRGRPRRTARAAAPLGPRGSHEGGNHAPAPRVSADSAASTSDE